MTTFEPDDWRLDRVEREVQNLDRQMQVFAPISKRLGDFEHRQDAHGIELDRLKHTIPAIHDDVKSVYRAVERLRSDMNGRLRALEVFQAGVETISQAFKWVPTVIGAVVGGTTTGLLVWILTH